MKARKNAKKTQTIGKPFAKGNAGRPKGALNKTTLAAQALLDGESERLTRKAVSMALKGNMAALRLCMERICPPRRERALSLELPTVEDATDLPKLTGAVMSSVTEGKLTPEEGARLMAMAVGHGRALEVYELERRVKALEEQK